MSGGGRREGKGREGKKSESSALNKGRDGKLETTTMTMTMIRREK